MSALAEGLGGSTREYQISGLPCRWAGLESAGLAVSEVLCVSLGTPKTPCRNSTENEPARYSRYEARAGGGGRERLTSEAITKAIRPCNPPGAPARDRMLAQPNDAARADPSVVGSLRPPEQLMDQDVTYVLISLSCHP